MAKRIPKAIQAEVLEIVEAYNKKHKKTFQITFRAQYAYLAKTERDMGSKLMTMLAEKVGISADMMPPMQHRKTETKLGRLKWTGDINKWEFAVFRYSREFYDPDEWMFPGAGEIDGTIEGALRAGEEIYK